MLALMDCNNFYVSCERVFNPRLENKPVVVLSNNDGCIISRSNEAKKLGIPMGAPFFKWQPFCKKNNVFVYSSNYELYGDMSQRVMSLLKDYCETIEIYSIDEAFLYFPSDISFTELIKLRQQIKQGTGIPISIGVSTTKTLAKAANYFAKNNSNENVFFLTNAFVQDEYLDKLPIEKIWGIGFNLTERLKVMEIHTAKQLRDADAKQIRSRFSVNVEKTVRELRGIACLSLEEPQVRKQIISSRSFGKKVTELAELEEAVSHYTNIASAKLRNQNSVAGALSVFLQTSLFTENKYGNSIMFTFPCSTADTRYLIHVAKKCLARIYKQGYQYHKAGIILSDISSQQMRQYDLLQPTIDIKSEKVMASMDRINKLMGRNTLYIAAEGIKRPWLIRCDKRSLRYTTRWHELLSVNFT